MLQVNSDKTTDYYLQLNLALSDDNLEQHSITVKRYKY